MNDIERGLIDKSLANLDSLSSRERELLQSMLAAFGMYAFPRKDNIRQLLAGTARHQLLDQPGPFLEELKLGIPPEFADIFWSVLTLPAVDFLFRQQLPTPDKVQEIVQAEDEHLTQEQQNCLYYLSHFISHLDQEELGMFLHFVTGSSVMPNKISVTFNRLTGELRRPIAHTCSNTLELSTTYMSSQELKREFINILNNTLCFQMDML